MRSRPDGHRRVERAEVGERVKDVFARRLLLDPTRDYPRNSGQPGDGQDATRSADSLLELDGVETGPLLGQPGGPPLPQSLVLDTPGLHLLGQVLGSGLFSLGLVDVLHQDTLVLESVTLGLEVERVVPAAWAGTGGASRVDRQ